MHPLLPDSPRGKQVTRSREILLLAVPLSPPGRTEGAAMGGCPYIGVCPVCAELQQSLAGKIISPRLFTNGSEFLRPPASLCGCLEERGKSRWELCLAMLAHPF